MDKILKIILSIAEGLLTVIVVVPVQLFVLIRVVVRWVVSLLIFCGIIHLLTLLPSLWFTLVFYGGILFSVSLFILLLWKPQKFHGIVVKRLSKS